ncbi:MAG: tetratricopeptide repeat protein [Planctomycetes bacterium]|nr:tetratricopeptide repeat protein [Planctomycetota bacterium]
MRIALIDPIPWDYSVWTVDRRPLGGSQSALCWLAKMLARRGNAVAAFTHTTVEQTQDGVECHSLSDGYAGLAGIDIDAAVILNSLMGIDQLRAILPEHCRLVLWTQHASDQPAIQGLGLDSIRCHLDGIAFVSQWQADQYRNRFTIGDLPAVVLRNGVNPCFGPRDIDESGPSPRRDPHTIAYTSAPYRGLSRLLRAFEHVRRHCDDAELRVFSGTAVYFQESDTEPPELAELLQRCRETRGVRLIGSLPQTELAEQLATCQLWAYPSTFAETSCIAALEAMASGCRVVASDLGALRETTAGFAELVPPQEPPDSFAETMLRVMLQAEPHSTAAATSADGIKLQQAHLQRHHCWSTIAAEWESWLAKLQRRPTIPASAIDWRELLAHGIRLHRSGMFAEAEEIYRRILASFPRHPDALHWLGMLAWESGDAVNALRLLDAAIRFGPDIAEFHNHRAVVLTGIGDLPSARQATLRALELDPEFSAAWVNLGNICRDSGDLDGAQQACEQAIGLQPGYADAHNCLGVVLRLQGKLENAIDAYRAALDANPKLVQAWNNLGAALLDQTRYNEAKDCFLQAIELAPQLAVLHANLGRAYRKIGDLQRAVQAMHRALQIDPTMDAVAKELQECRGG